MRRTNTHQLSLSAKKILFPFLLLLLHQVVFSQQPYQQWKWAKSYGGSSRDSSVDMKIKNGFLYVTGNFTSTQINWANTLINNNGGTDIFVAKLDTLGNTIWVKQFGGTGNDYALQLEINNSGTSVIRCKSASGSITVGSNTLSNPKDFYIELNSNGSVVNAKTFPAEGTYNDIDIDQTGAVFTSGSYKGAFTFAGAMVDTSYTKAGAVIFKYKADGSEEWTKYIPCFNELHFPGDPWNTYNWQNNENVLASFKIEYSDIDTSLTFICQYYQTNYIILTQIGYQSGGSSYVPAYGVGYIYGKISNNAGLGYFSRTAFDGPVPNFETAPSGLTYTGYHYRNLAGAIRHIRRDYNETRSDTLTWLDYGTGPYYYPEPYPFIYNYSTFSLNENGSYLMINNINPNGIEVLDSNLNRRIKITVPAFGSQTWNNKCMADTNAFYFADTYSNPSVLLNNQVIGSSLITLTNAGASNIFVGKYIPGRTLFKLDNLKSVYKTCSTAPVDTVQLGLVLDSLNIVFPVTFHWQASSQWSDTTILNPKVYVNADSVVNTLTVTDANGGHVSKRFVFYKLIPTHIGFSLSATTVCQLDTVSISLTGTNYLPCLYATNDPYGFAIPWLSVQSFDSISHIRKYQPYQTHDVWLVDNPNVPGYLRYCVQSDTLHVRVGQPYNNTTAFSVCYGSSYTFPDNTVLNNITANTSHDSHLSSSTFCDSIITTNLSVNPVYNTSENISLCSGSSHTFPDNTIQNNITANTSHTSHFSSVSGCDSNIVTNISVIVIDTGVNKALLVLSSNASSAAYQWLNCVTNTIIASATSQSYTVTAAGSYAVEVKKQGCTDTSSCFVITTDNILNGDRNIVNVYPVPTTDRFTMVLQSESPATLFLSLTDFTGTIVKTERLNLLTGSNTIVEDISILAPGIYTLKLVRGDTNEVIIKRIVKQ